MKNLSTPLAKHEHSLLTLQGRKTNDPKFNYQHFKNKAMTDCIEITESNYKDYCSLDIVAFLFAQPGAMGDPGGVEIIDDHRCAGTVLPHKLLLQWCEL